jgi:CubicO group peptidase (beta-lactamase class C family)
MTLNANPAEAGDLESGIAEINPDNGTQNIYFQPLNPCKRQPGISTKRYPEAGARGCPGEPTPVMGIVLANCRWWQGGGKLGDVRLLSERAVRNATQRQDEAPGRSVLPIDMRWRLGYHGVPTTAGFLHNGFGHFGFGGSGGFADRNRDLAVALIVNCGMGTPFGDLRVARMSGAAVTCAREADRRTAARRSAAETDVADVASFAAFGRNG